MELCGERVCVFVTKGCFCMAEWCVCVCGVCVWSVCVWYVCMVCVVTVMSVFSSRHPGYI